MDHTIRGFTYPTTANGPPVVDQECLNTLGATHPHSLDTRDRCFDDGLGGLLPEHGGVHRKPVVDRGGGTSHKLVRAQRSFSYTAVFYQGHTQFPHSPSDGQSSDNHIHQQKRETRSRALCNLALKLWNWCIQRGISIEARHLQGLQNTRAYFESRQTDPCDLHLDQAVFEKITVQLGKCSIDLFASYKNTQTERFYSWKPDPKSEAIDALSQSWKNHHQPYFSPRSL